MTVEPYVQLIDEYTISPVPEPEIYAMMCPWLRAVGMDRSAQKTSRIA